MVYIFILIIGTLCLVTFRLIINFKNSNLDFQKRVQLLEEIILKMKTNLEIQNQKVTLSEDLKQKIKSTNQNLNKAVFNLNYEIFEELYAKK